MTQEELDDKLRKRFINTLDDAHQFAKEKRDIEALGQLAQLIGTCIDWDKGVDEEKIVVGFKPKDKDKEQE